MRKKITIANIEIAQAPSTAIAVPLPLGGRLGYGAIGAATRHFPPQTRRGGVPPPVRTASANIRRAIRESPLHDGMCLRYSTMMPSPSGFGMVKSARYPSSTGLWENVPLPCRFRHILMIHPPLAVLPFPFLQNSRIGHSSHRGARAVQISLPKSTIRWQKSDCSSFGISPSITRSV